MRFAATLIAMAVGTAASAQGFGEGAWYAKAFGGVTLPGDELTTVDGLIWAFAKEPRRIIWPGPPGMDLDYDAGTTLGAAVGLAVMPRVGVELEYAPIAGATRHGQRPPKLAPIKGILGGSPKGVPDEDLGSTTPLGRPFKGAKKR